MEPDLTLCVLVDSGVGKTSLVYRYITGDFRPELDLPFNEHDKRVNIDDQVLNLRLIDTYGGEEWSEMNKEHIQQSEGFLLCYSITQIQSLNYLKSYIFDLIMNEQHKHADSQRRTTVLLVGTKSDLDDQRQVHPSDSNDVLSALKGRFNTTVTVGESIIETSAKHDRNVQECIAMAVRNYRSQLSQSNSNISVSESDSICCVLL